MKNWHRPFVAAAVALALTACADRAGPPETAPIRPEDLTSTASPAQEPVADEPAAASQPAVNADTPLSVERYVDLLVQETISRFVQPGMGDYEKAKAAFDYMIETATLLDPVGLELWRVRDPGSPPLSYLENRSLSVLQFHLGKCEDYAAAFTLLLQGMGLEAEYVPGLTYSAQGELVDHAWTVANIDGVWYHLDCQLEQNISRYGNIRYKYFMRGDGTMSGSHRWGQNLINSRLLSEAQNEEIARDFIPPACPQDYPSPERRPCTLPQPPDVSEIEAAVAAEIGEYESAHGALEPLEINVVPPVFALEGYGPRD